MLSITSEWGNHTTQLLKLTPYSSKAIVIGKITANVIKCCVSGIAFLAIFFMISRAFPPPVHLIFFIISILLVYGIFACLGMCIGIFIKSSLTAFLFSLVSALVLWVGGGGFGPLSYYGDIANFLGKINPATYAIDIVRWCYFNGNTAACGGFTILGIAFIVALFLIFTIFYEMDAQRGGYVMRVFAAELKKLLILFKADPKSLVAGIIAPTIILIVFAFTFGDFTSLKLAYVNEDTGVYGEELETAVFTQISPLGDRPYFEETETDYETAMELYQQGKINGVIIVPETFSADLEDGKNANIDYIFNNYNTDMGKKTCVCILKRGYWIFTVRLILIYKLKVEEVLNVETAATLV